MLISGWGETRAGPACSVPKGRESWLFTPLSFSWWQGSSLVLSSASLGDGLRQENQTVSPISWCGYSQVFCSTALLKLLRWTSEFSLSCFHLWIANYCSLWEHPGWDLLLRHPGEVTRNSAHSSGRAYVLLLLLSSPPLVVLYLVPFISLIYAAFIIPEGL